MGRKKVKEYLLPKMKSIMESLKMTTTMEKVNNIVLIPNLDTLENSNMEDDMEMAVFRIVNKYLILKVTLKTI